MTILSFGVILSENIYFFYSCNFDKILTKIMIVSGWLRTHNLSPQNYRKNKHHWIIWNCLWSSANAPRSQGDPKVMQAQICWWCKPNFDQKIWMCSIYTLLSYFRKTYASDKFMDLYFSLQIFYQDSYNLERLE